MTDHRRNKRSWKHFLIRKDVQFYIIKANLVFIVVVSAVLIAVLLSPLYQDTFFADDLMVQNVSGKLFLVLLRRIALAMLLIVAMAAVHQLVLSHRIGGPLINFGHTFDKMAKGNFTRRVSLRKKDCLKSEADRVNAVIDRLNADGQRLGEAMQAMSMLVEALEGQRLAGETAALVDRLAEPVDTCRAVLSSWTLGPRE